MSQLKYLRPSFGKAFAKNFLQWFPGHMGKGMKQMQQQLMNVDCILEVHDARIPLSGRNEVFRTTLLGVRPHLLVLNKCDLIPKDQHSIILNAVKNKGYASDVLFTDCRTPEGPGVRDVLPTITNKIMNVHRYNRQSEKSYNLLVIGVPNVGKSSLINVLRNYHSKRKKATKVGPVAGVTRSVLTKIQVSYEPLIYLLDSPGILEPQVRDVEAAFRLALCASMQDHLVGIINIADYLLYWLNKHGHYSYVEKLGLKEPSDDILEVLTLYALNEKLTKKMKDLSTGKMVVRPNIESAATNMVRMFRRGELGLFFLDCDLLL
ncbi:mitochondrial GTPase 1 [Thrips palmi]|uniref:Mitochondrial GTPase 1 n=1 Tax=Thrips palmi TaxID=161013 RepID=A0A6P9A7F0_THRPL|nr:mitochondrial GTPase 1 [Thrips palmi]